MSEGLYGYCKCGRSCYEPGGKCASCRRDPKASAQGGMEYCEFCGEPALYEYTTPRQEGYRRFSCSAHTGQVQRLVRVDNGMDAFIDCRNLLAHEDGPKRVIDAELAEAPSYTRKTTWDGLPAFQCTVCTAGPWGDRGEPERHTDNCPVPELKRLRRAIAERTAEHTEQMRQRGEHEAEAIRAVIASSNRAAAPPVDNPPAERQSLMMGEDGDGHWWIVFCEDGEPASAWHPTRGRMDKAWRDSFGRWSIVPGYGLEDESSAAGMRPVAAEAMALMIRMERDLAEKKARDAAASVLEKAAKWDNGPNCSRTISDYDWRRRLVEEAAALRTAEPDREEA